MTESVGKNWPQRISLAILVAYWCVLFIATHVPIPQPDLGVENDDKWIHAFAYGVLALLVATAWSLRANFGWRQAFIVLVILAIYGALDEITQIPVNRQADVADWLFDVVGIVVGLAVFLAVRAWRRHAA
jgi:VanZ family protein